MKRYGFFVICLVAVVLVAGRGWAEPYRILHKQGAIYTLGTGWNLDKPPYYPGTEWAVDMVADSQGVTILHKDGALWQEVGGWDMSSPPYYPGSNYAQALDAGAEEVRIPISSLPYTITQSGSYYITGDLTASGTGITVEADNVTIDLMGYSLIGPGSGTNYGVFMNGRSNVEVRNGTVTNFGSTGIFDLCIPDIGRNYRVIEVRAVGNGGGGIGLGGYGNLVKDCTASENHAGIGVGKGATVTGNTAYNNGISSGISAGYGSTVTGNTAYNNGTKGISGGAGSTVTGNTGYNNGTHGISAGTGSTVTGNTAYNNGENGIYVQSQSAVTGNTAYDNGVIGIEAHYASMVRDNTVNDNQDYGIMLGSNSLVDGNIAYNNCLSAEFCENIQECATCTWGTNHNPAIP